MRVENTRTISAGFSFEKTRKSCVRKTRRRRWRKRRRRRRRRRLGIVRYGAQTVQKASGNAAAGGGDDGCAVTEGAVSTLFLIDFC